MARYLGPSCRLCRSQREKLMLKGDRCLSPKCPIDKKNSLLRKGIPGKPASARLKKISDYGNQLKEKQKIKNLYGLLETQFRRYFEMASRKKGITGDNLIKLLESRLDNIIYRMHFATSRKQARQLILHGHITVNSQVVNIPSFNIKEQDVISVSENSKKIKSILDSLKRVNTLGVVPWLSVNADDAKGTVNQLPRRSEIEYAANINEKLVVELYSK